MGRGDESRVESRGEDSTHCEASREEPALCPTFISPWAGPAIRTNLVDLPDMKKHSY